MTMTGRTLLVLGGARSGKSNHARHTAEAIGGTLVYLATAEASDAEMAARIARHQAERDARWRTVEAPRALPAAIAREDRAGAVLLVDCLTLWASNGLLAGDDMAARTDDLGRAVLACRCPLILVSNEVGQGIVPDNALARAFRDVAGMLNQRIAAIVESVDMLHAGLVLPLKRPPG